MRRYRLGSHARYDLKVHLVWVPKYRKRVLTGAVAVRVRDLLRQIAAENDLQIISGKVAADHVHLFLSYRAHQNISQIVQWLKGISSRLLLQELVASGTKGNGLSEADLDVFAKLPEQRLERGEEAEAFPRGQVVAEDDLLQLGLAQRVEVEVARQVAP